MLESTEIPTLCFEDECGQSVNFSQLRSLVTNDYIKVYDVLTFCETSRDSFVYWWAKWRLVFQKEDLQANERSSPKKLQNCIICDDEAFLLLDCLKVYKSKPTEKELSTNLPSTEISESQPTLAPMSFQAENFEFDCPTLYKFAWDDAVTQIIKCNKCHCWLDITQSLDIDRCVCKEINSSTNSLTQSKTC